MQVKCNPVILFWSMMHILPKALFKKILVPIDKTTFVSHNKKQHMCRK